MLEFVVLTTANLWVLICLIRRYSPFSAEGLALWFVMLSIVADAVGLFWTAAVAPQELRLGRQEFYLRLYPSVVHFFGLLSFGLGLLVVNPRPTSLRRTLTSDVRHKLFMSGLLMSICGLGLFMVGIRLVGAHQSDTFYATVDHFRSEELGFGGFWYRGIDIALFGLTLMFATSGHNNIKRFFFGTAILILPLMLSSNKGGLEKSVLYGAFSLFAFDHATFKRIAKTKVIIPGVLLIVLATGVKNFILGWGRPSFEGGDLTLSLIADSGLRSIEDRYSNEGLYRGFCTMVTYLHDGQGPFYEGRILRYTLDSWIPRFLWPEKADNPFRAIGYMVNPDGHVYTREVSAPTFVGYAYGDFGLLSTVSYLFAGGLFLGAFRRFCTRPKKSLNRRVAYLFFAVLGGVSPEGGFIGIIYIIIMAFACVLPMTCVDCFAASRKRLSLPFWKRLEIRGRACAVD